MSIIEQVHAKMNGGELDVLFALHFRGSLEIGDIPAKSGLTELMEKGVAGYVYPITGTNDRYTLTVVGKALAKSYYEAKAEAADELTRRSSFTVAELKAKLEQHVVRWMSSDVPSVRDAFPDDCVFEFADVEYNPAYELRKFLIEDPATGLRGRLTFTISDRHTDCDSTIFK